MSRALAELEAAIDVAIAKTFTGMATSRERASWARRKLKNAGRSKYGERFYRFKDGDSKIKVRIAHGGDLRGEAHSEVHWSHKPTLGARLKRAVGLKTKKPNFARAAAGSVAAMERDAKRTGTSAYRIYGLNRTHGGGQARRGRENAHAKIYRRMASSHKVDGMQTDLSNPNHITFRRVRKSVDGLYAAIAKAREAL